MWEDRTEGLQALEVYWKDREEVPGSPQNVRVSGTSTAQSISVEWEPPVSPNGVLLEYLVTRSSEDSSSSLTITTPGTTCTLSGLLPCTTYTINVSATTSKGSGPPGDTIAATEPNNKSFNEGHSGSSGGDYWR
ncbi:hypothetical protein Pcinc_014850 [Petrolisthes cinctipes]|uniref:Fibronectin type-III domain-containing protein n=1 Tax=Petrolisthes cinctipes TaxID=88211 RepID=A0AAE1FUB6_PETCI|nr:hypothetical protein Pcinc_014850 [Petrolisthes cinctipes]